MNTPNDTENPNAPGTGTAPSTSNDRPADQEPKFRIRAAHSESTITVYQAYHPRIGTAAARNVRFPSRWSRERMTWTPSRVDRPLRVGRGKGSRCGSQRPAGWLESQSVCWLRTRSRSAGVARMTSAPPS
ncbi:DUF4291 family protein [Streptomyces sp. NPDC060053]|uniref:DUF4291 family protein n=1 Tax=Streptomyces sp. NPDC060053 TaxID=3347047 RepID=UPI00367E3DDA